MKTLIVLLGPTGVGKTELSLTLAEMLRTPIINADSRQIYRDIPIGTAAPTAEEMQRVRHYFVGILGLDQYYSAAIYEAEVMAFLSKQFLKSDVAIMSGGAMLYIDAVCNGIDEIPNVSDEVRSWMKLRLADEGLEPMVEELKVADPEYAASCDLNNPRRVVYALEVFHTTGRKLSSFRTNVKKERPFRIVKIGLNRDRAELFGRINGRVTDMVNRGWLEEAKRVLPFRHYNSLNTVGYKELFRHLDGEWELDFSLDRIRKNTRVYAKKQLTWFAKDEKIRWFHPAELDEIRYFILSEAQVEI